MSLKYGVLSLLAFCLIVLLSFKNYEIWNHPIELFPGKQPARRPEKKTEIPPMIEAHKDPISIQSYISIAGKNIFNPERRDFPILQGPRVGVELHKKPAPRPQIVLYGVTISESCQSATIANPGRPLKKGERETMTVKLGEQIGEYRLTKILPDRIMMESPEDNFEILLYDPSKPKRRMEVRTETKPATITSTAPVSTPVPVTAAPPAPAPVTPPVPKPMEIPKPVPPRETPEERVIRQPVPRPIPPSSSPMPPGRGRSPVYPTPAPPRPDTGEESKKEGI